MDKYNKKNCLVFLLVISLLDMNMAPVGYGTMAEKDRGVSQTMKATQVSSAAARPHS
jgi:hypothetical protein